MRDKREDSETDKGKGHAETEAETGVLQPPSRGRSHQKPGEGHDSPSEPTKTQSCQYLPFGLLVTELEENKFLLG